MAATDPPTSRRLRPSVVGAVLALGGTLLVLPVGFMLEHPFWLDEAWVAVGTKAPLGALPFVSFPGPAGWSVLLRLPWPGEQGMRMVTILFSAGTVFAAYLLGRDLGWSSKKTGSVVGGLAGLAVLLSPWSLTRQDLKQYTADACLALIVLWLASRVEQDREDRSRLIWFGGVAAVASVISWTSMFVAGAALLALFIVACARREGRQARDVLGAGVLLVSFYLGVYAVLIAPYVSDNLSVYWIPYYLQGDVRSILAESWSRMRALTDGSPPGWLYVGVVALVAGVAIIWRRRPATALSIPLLVILMMGLAVFEKYPFLDRRTSHFLLMVGVAVAAVSIGAAVAWAMKKSDLLGWSLVVTAASVLVWVGLPFVRTPSLPDEDIRSQTRYLVEHRASGEPIVANSPAQFGLTYYWPEADLVFTQNSWGGFRVNFVEDPFTLTANTSEGVIDGVSARYLDDANLWLVLTHLSPEMGDETESFLEAEGIGFEVIPVGVEPLRLLLPRD